LEHHFNVEVAEKYGVNCAVILHNLVYWQLKNKANKANFRDGRYWTFNSISAFTELFPYLSQKQIRTALDKLIEEGLIVADKLSDNPYNHTKWYSVTAKGMALYGIIEMPTEANVDLPIEETRFAVEGKSYKEQIVNNTDSKPDKKHSLRFVPPTLEEVQQYISEKGLKYVKAEDFYNYFTEGNWTDSKGNKVKNWKQKLLTWENMKKEKAPKEEEKVDSKYFGVVI